MKWQEIAGMFAEIELRLIQSLKRNLKRHMNWEKAEGFQWPAWQGVKLWEIDRFRRENRAIVKEYAPVVDEATSLLMQRQFEEGQAQTDREMEELGAPKPPVQGQFFGVNDEKVNALIEDIQSSERTAESSTLRVMDDVYRKTVLKAQTAMSLGATTLSQAVDLAVKDFLSQGINSIEYRDGRRVNIASYAEMALRTAATRAYLRGEAKRREEYGVDTVLVSQYGACSETCLPWQGRVYIDDVWGEFAGETSSTMGKSRNGRWYPLLSVAVKAGLFHPNCRHTLSTWYEGISRTPRPMDEELVKRASKLEQRQRAMEREVRRYKRLAEGTLEPDAAEGYRRKTRQAQKRLREFVKEHHGLLRRDPWREQTLGVPIVQDYKSVNLTPIPITNKGITDVRLVKSDVLGAQLSKDLQKGHRKLLRMLSAEPNGIEAIAYYDLQMRPIASYVGSTSSVRSSPMSVPYLIMHNHPSGTTFTHQDIAKFYKDDLARVMTAVGNDGTVFLVEKIPSYDKLKYKEYYRQTLTNHTDCLSSPEKYMDFMTDLLRGGEQCGVRYASKGE